MRNGPHDFGTDDRGIEIDDTPTADGAIDRSAIRTSPGLHRMMSPASARTVPVHTPGTLFTGIDHADAELIVRVAREVMVEAKRMAATSSITDGNSARSERGLAFVRQRP
ncbi:MAG TPA: hypothetical protein VKE70_39140, partial [Candidatus Solibacter sp.]|nr:hypothetical protein [Candidatus Solibacter sp.]